MALPNTGFQFSSWIENLGHMASETVSTVDPNPPPFDPLVHVISGLLGYPENIPDEFNIKKHGKFTANFVKVAPPIEPQFWIPIYGVIIGSIFGWSIPKMSEWIKGSKQRKEFIKYQKEIDFSYSDKLEMHDLKKLDGIMIK